ncbi:MAG: tetratricopeptide repeat protein [Bdellovibrionales bacterium]|nr:tetratricopeptide repeat protein [Bdellovibrionales bacterium]
MLCSQRALLSLFPIRRSVGLALLCILTSCATGEKEQDSYRAELHLQIGTSLMSQGQYPRAMAELLKAQELDPKNPVVQNNLGLSYLVRGRLKEAEQHLRKAVELNPKYTEARNNLGRILLDEHKYTEAAKELKLAALDLTYPNPASPLANLGEAYFALKQYSLARKTLAESIRYRRENCSAVTYYGRSLFELKQYAPASQALDEAVRICNPELQQEPYYFSSLSHLQNGNLDMARSRWKESLENCPRGKYAGAIRNLMKSRNEGTVGPQ